MRGWVVRVALEPDHPWLKNDMVENLRYAGLVVVHNDRIIDICPPAGTSASSSLVWAKQNAERIASFGHNAVAAPRWEKV